MEILFLLSILYIIFLIIIFVKSQNKKLVITSKYDLINLPDQRYYEIKRELFYKLIEEHRYLWYNKFGTAIDYEGIKKVYMGFKEEGNINEKEFPKNITINGVIPVGDELWIGYFNLLPFGEKGKYCFSVLNLKTEKIRNYSFIGKNGGYIIMIYIMKEYKGKVYMGTSDGLVIIDKKKGPEKYEFYAAGFIRALDVRENSKGEIAVYFGVGQKIFLFKNGAVQEIYKIKEPPTEEIPSDILHILIVDNLLYLGINRGNYSLSIYNLDTKKEKWIPGTTFVKSIVLLDENDKKLFLLATIDGLKYYYKEDETDAERRWEKLKFNEKTLIELGLKNEEMIKAPITSDAYRLFNFDLTVENIHRFIYSGYSILPYSKLMKFYDKSGNINILAYGNKFAVLLLKFYKNRKLDIDDLDGCIFPKIDFLYKTWETDSIEELLFSTYNFKTYRPPFDLSDKNIAMLVLQYQYMPFQFATELKHINAAYWDKKRKILWLGSYFGDICKNTLIRNYIHI